jgi:sugar phosphate isomerase/epimerase
VVLDTWNWYVGGNGMDLINELAVNQVVSVRLADAPPDADRETIQEDARLLPGKGGAIDCVAVLRRLLELDYEGPVTPYPHPAGFAAVTRDTIVKDTSDALDEAWKAATAPPEVAPAGAVSEE